MAANPEWAQAGVDMQLLVLQVVEYSYKYVMLYNIDCNKKCIVVIFESLHNIRNCRVNARKIW